MSFVISRRKVYLSSFGYMAVLALGRNVMFRNHPPLICLGYFRGDNFRDPVEQLFA
jgi:hypothetical protein